MPRFGNADQGRRDHRSDRAGIDPAIGMAADRAVDGAVIHAGAAADAAQHLLRFRAQQCAAAVIQQHHMELFRPIGVFGTARAGGKGRVAGKFLAGGGARQHPQDRAGVLQRRHDLFQAGDNDMNLRQGLGQVAIAFIGDDDG